MSESTVANQLVVDSNDNDDDDSKTDGGRACIVLVVVARRVVVADGKGVTKAWQPPVMLSRARHVTRRLVVVVVVAVRVMVLLLLLLRKEIGSFLGDTDTVGLSFLLSVSSRGMEGQVDALELDAVRPSGRRS
jgi:hypothetical protein